MSSRITVGFSPGFGQSIRQSKKLGASPEQIKAVKLRVKAAKQQRDIEAELKVLATKITGRALEPAFVKFFQKQGDDFARLIRAQAFTPHGNILGNQSELPDRAEMAKRLARFEAGYLQGEFEKVKQLLLAAKRARTLETHEHLVRSFQELQQHSQHVRKLTPQYIKRCAYAFAMAQPKQATSVFYDLGHHPNGNGNHKGKPTRPDIRIIFDTTRPYAMA